MMDAVREERSKTHPVWTIVALLIVGNGIWAFAAPHSFYETIATYPPYNRHLFHDIGAFTTGLGLAILAATRFRNALLVALIGNAAAAVMHAISHIIDRDLGGRSSDPWFLSAVAVAITIPAVLRLRGAR
jgi:NO-binding membrane sensor protein with MHYT domain